MSQVSDVSLANQGFSAFRSELNNILGAINTSHIGTSAPGSIAQGTIWIDTSAGATGWVLKLYDGAGHISLGTINSTANTVDWTDSVVTTELANDSSPQLGGYLDINGNDITSASNADVDINPHGTGNVVLITDLVSVGGGSEIGHISSNGAYDLKLDTNSSTNSGSIVITDGANGDIDITTNGTGAIKFNDLAYIPQQALTSSSNAVAWDAQAKPNAYHLTTENTTLSAPSNAVEGAFICIEVNFDGSHTFSWNAVFNFAADTAPTTTDTNGKTDIFVFRYNGAIWQEVGRTLNIPES